MRTGEVCVLDATSSLVKEAMYLLFQNKYAKTDPISDRHFIERCLSSTKRSAPTAASLPGPRNVIKVSSAPLFVED